MCTRMPVGTCLAPWCKMWRHLCWARACSASAPRTATFQPGHLGEVMFSIHGDRTFPGLGAVAMPTRRDLCFWPWRRGGGTAVPVTGTWPESAFSGTWPLSFSPDTWARLVFSLRVHVAGFGPTVLFGTAATVARGSSLRLPVGVEGGGTNPCDAGLDLSGSWQQGHSATYNAPSRFKSSAKDSARRPLGRELRGGPPRRVGRAS